MNIVEVVKEYVRYPSVSADPAFAEGVKGSYEFIAKLLEKAGAKPEIVPTRGNPVVVGRFNAGKKNLPHIVVYGHYDVQPADPVELWETPPFEATVRNGKIFGRGTADNKGPHAVSVVALANLLARRPDLPLRVTFVFEGEEEIGSTHFREFLDAHAGEFSEGDFVLLSDTSSPSESEIAITIGLRGMMGLEVNVEGPNSDLHSGLHGGAVVNPLQALMEVCASLHNADGTVNVPGFYDGVREPASWEREEFSRFPQSEEEYRKFLDVEALYGVPGYSPLECARFMPTLEFNGVGGGYQGTGSKTIIPAKAFAKITCRLVPGQDPADIREKVSTAILSRMPAGVRVTLTPMQGNPAYFVCPPNRPNTPPEMNPALARAFEAAEKIITEKFGNAPIYTREGGSIGIIEDFRRITGMDSLMIGFFTADSRIHAPNENADIGMLEKGVATYEAIFESCAGTAD